MVGTHSQYLRGWEKPTRKLIGCFHEVKIIHTTRGPKKEGEKKEVIFFYGKTTMVTSNPNVGGGLMLLASLIILLSWGGIWLLTGTWVPREQ